MRNVVMSGMAMGTVVVEASSTSGAKMQARLALEHGKRLFLLESLVESQEWARRYAARPGVSIVRQLDDVLEVLVKLVSVPEQLVLQI
jgi:DNA processing protein